MPFFNKQGLNAKRFSKKTYLPYYMTQLTLSPHSPIIAKIIDVENLVTQIDLVTKVLILAF